MSEYAKQTSVSPEKSRAEIEQILRRYGADQFISGWSGYQAMIGFKVKGRAVRFVLHLPEPGDKEFSRDQMKREETEACCKAKMFQTPLEITLT